MRTQQEILAKMEEVKSIDIFGVIQSDLIDYLDFNNAKQFLQEGVKEHEWNENYPKSDPAAEIREYLPFAWKKANDCRGLSAARSLMHLHAWLWLMGKDDLVTKLDDYQYYGKPQLVMCGKLVGFDHSTLTTQPWVNDECGDPLPDDEKLEIIEQWEGYAL